jgi:RNA polymerase sigma factor (sigma-70 family)
MLPKPHKTIALTDLISESMRGNIKMQQLLYQQFAAPMYYVCLRYLKHVNDAEDVLQEGFIKVFKNLDNYKNQGSFEGWVRTIMIRTALSHLRDNKKHNYHLELQDTIEEKGNNVINKISEKEILGIVTKLPPGFKKIFMLYAVEGYNHREIAVMLGCSEGTCKSQFYRSKNRLQKILMQTA